MPYIAKVYIPELQNVLVVVTRNIEVQGVNDERLLTSIVEEGNRGVILGPGPRQGSVLVFFPETIPVYLEHKTRLPKRTDASVRTVRCEIGVVVDLEDLEIVTHPD